MTDLAITPENRIPIKEAAHHMGVLVETAIRRCKKGQLTHTCDGCNHYWTSLEAIAEFNTARTHISPAARQKLELRRYRQLLYNDPDAPPGGKRVVQGGRKSA